jgi:dynein heavy chain
LLYLGVKKVDEGKLQTMRTSEEHKAILAKFFDPSGRTQYLFAIPAGADSLRFQLEVPDKETLLKHRKIVMAQRTRKPAPGEELVITEENARAELLFSECNKAVLENLYKLCHDVYLPVLGNPANVSDMSELVSKDLMEKFHTFLAHTYVTIGSVKGRTQLPLPPKDITSSDKISSKDKGNQLEQAIAHWTRQIKGVLKQDPESALKGNKHPNPLVELEFWKNKSDNLNYICQQLYSERVKKCLKFLEQNKSTYTGPFSKLQKDVQVARAEANDNELYLYTLAEEFNKLTRPDLELAEIKDLFMPIMHLILLIWTYSTYYNTPARLVVLIRRSATRSSTSAGRPSTASRSSRTSRTRRPRRLTASSRSR